MGQKIKIRCDETSRHMFRSCRFPIKKFGEKPRMGIVQRQAQA